jgi:hypothetical protein
MKASNLHECTDSIAQTGLQGAEYMVSYLWKPMSMSMGVVLSLELGPKN